MAGNEPLDVSTSLKTKGLQLLKLRERDKGDNGLFVFITLVYKV